MSDLGLILAGGKSSRFKTNKALAEVNGVTMAGRVALVMAAVLGKSRLMVLADVAEPYGFLELPVLVDETPHQGPAVALLGAARQLTADHLLVCPCDMPWVTPALLGALLENMGSADACVFESEAGGPSPLPGVYRRAALAALDPADHASLKSVLAALDKVVVLSRGLAMALDESGRGLDNVNYQADLPQAGRAFSTAGGTP